MPNNMEFDKNSQGPNKGVSGYAENQLARNRVNRFAFGTGDNQESGFLNDAIQNADALIQKIKEVEKALGGANKVTEKMTETQRKAYEHSKSDAKLLSDTMKEIQKTGTLSQAELNQLVKDNEKISKESIKTLTNLINSMDKTSSENVKDQKKLIEETNLAIQKQNEQVTKSKQEMKELNQELKDTQDTFTKGLGNTLKSAGSKLGELANMLNLQSVANNVAEQNARSKAAIMNEVNKQFGFTSDSQFNDFKNSLNNSLKDMNSEMGSIFNADDLKNYMANLSQYGINSTQMAQEQMRASIIGNKYLGVSANTQEMIFKYLKRTNNNDAINEHNRMVVGLLNSQLGVSKEQLDALTQTTYSDMEAMAAAGVSQEAQDNYKYTANAVKSTLESINQGWGDSFGTVLTDIASKSVTELSSQYGAIFGSDIIKAQQELYSTGDAVSVTKSLLSSNQFRRFLNQSNDQFTNEYLRNNNVNPALANMVRYFQTNGSGDFNNKLDEALESIKNTSDSDVNKYVEETTEVTLLEKIQNRLGLLTNGIDWKHSMNLATAAAGLIIAGETVNMVKTGLDFFSNVKQAGGISNLFKNFFSTGSVLGKGAQASSTLVAGGGKAGAALGALGAGTVAVGLTAAAIAGIVAGANAMVKGEREAADNNLQSNLNSQKGTRYEGDTGRAYTTGLNNKIGTVKEGQSTASSYFSIGNFAKNFLGQASNGLTEWTQIFNHGDPNKYNINKWNNFQKTVHGLFNEYELRNIEYAYALALDEVGSFNTAKSLFNIDGASVANWLSDPDLSNEDVQKAFKRLGRYDLFPIGNNNKKWDGSWDPYKWWDDQKGEWINKYAMAGLDWVPRDNFIIQAHKGEMLLNAREAAMYRKNFGYGGSLNANASDYVGPHHSGYAGHNGIDLYFGEIGTPVGSAVAGRVIESKDIPVNWNDGKMHGKDSNGTAYSSYGRVVKVLGDDGHTYIYGHLNERKVNTGDIVSAGTLLGYSGTTGNSSGPHLHFEVAGAGTGEAAHAKYYTPFVRNVTGAAGSTNIADSDSNASAVNTLGSRRYIPKSLSSGGFGGSEGASQIVNSVDGGFDKLIKYLDSISKEQNEQRALLETYSIAKGSESNY